MQALIERAHQLGVLPSQRRTSLYKQISSRGWRRREPGSDSLPPERPQLTSKIGLSLFQRGLTADEVAQLAGFASPDDNPFNPGNSHLRVV